MNQYHKSIVSFNLFRCFVLYFVYIFTIVPDSRVVVAELKVR